MSKIYLSLKVVILITVSTRIIEESGFNNKNVFKEGQLWLKYQMQNVCF